MAREQTFTPGTVVSSVFLNDRQDLESALTFIRVELASATAIRVPVVADGSPNGQTPAIINGQPRVNGTPYVLGLSTSSQGSQPVTYDIYATPQGSTIIGDGTYGFVLQLVGRTGGTPYGGAPGTVPATSRKVAELDWSGATIVALRNTIEVAGHAYHHRFGGGDPLPAASVDVSMLAASATNKSAFVGDLKMSVAAGDHGPRGDGTFEWVLISANRRLSQASYPTLYAAMGSPALDGNNTFALPAVNDRALVAAGTTHPVGTTWGAESVGLTADQLPHHYHGVAIQAGTDYPDHLHYVPGQTAGGGTDAQYAAGGAYVPTGTWSAYSPGASTAGGNYPRSGNPPSSSSLYHSHNVSVNVGAVNSAGANTRHNHDVNGNTGGGVSYESGQPLSGQAHENRQPSVAVNCFIKT